MVAIPGNLFCFTGKFVYGTQDRCRQAILERVGECSTSISEAVDYLVVGELQQINLSSAGGEQYQTVSDRERDKKIRVVPESLWVSAL